MIKKHPHILLITDDQHRYDFFGHTKYVPGLHTPNWDRLFSQGVNFTQAVSNCPICMPTRYSWLTGLYASQAAEGLLRNAHDWPTEHPTCAQILQKNNYHTALIGKLHSHAGLTLTDLGNYEQETHDWGFDDVVEVSGKSLSHWYDCAWTKHLASKNLLETYRQRYTTIEDQFAYAEEIPIPFAAEDTMDGFISAQAQDWLQNYSSDNPFFCHVSFCGPHFPLDPPAQYWNKWKDADVPAPEASTHGIEKGIWLKRRRAYCALIEQLDDEIGKLLHILEERNLLENTIIIYTCDHGDMLGHKDQWHKGKPYDSSARVPFVVHAPLRFQARSCNQPIEAVDLSASILDFAGIFTDDDTELLPNSPGQSLSLLLNGDESNARAYAYSEANNWRMLRNHQWKYIYRIDEEDELYDLTNDPWEAKNQIHNIKYTQQLQEMKDQLLHCLSTTLSPNTKAVPPLVLDPRSERLL
ncbi:MAG: sulfatase-like hydrolase/transferase [Planctomycetes bacterium]|nr:sulfatase-like hydrolase/transferase [Planctomycetota bacterium]